MTDDKTASSSSSSSSLTPSKRRKSVTPAMYGKLVIIRGPAGSGKSTVTNALLNVLREGEHCTDAETITCPLAEKRNVAYLEQDLFRNVILGKHTDAATLSGQLLATSAIECIENGTDVILEGILNIDKYRDCCFEVLYDRLPKECIHFFYLNVDLEETKKRHMGREKINVFGTEKLDKWWNSARPTGYEGEVMIDSSSALASTVQKIVNDVYLKA